MAQSPGMIDYLSFMQWFQAKYPDMYVLHWKTIVVPTDGEGVTVDKDGMDLTTYKHMVDLTKEYYLNEHR